ncbi:acetolactate synthase large subunit, partial [Candidatus Marinimicrobia bacterium]|nr:acetolactate synthase large subunit [Candidatus Neomarinimicrobiota bacterium]
KDLQAEEFDFIYPEEPILLPGANLVTSDIDSNSLEQAASLIAESKRPVILAGHGILLSGASSEVIELSEKGNIPLS